MLAGIIIGSMVLIAVLSVYNSSQRTANAVTEKLENARYPIEVLQRIAEDLDTIIAAGSDVRIKFETKVESHGYRTAQLEIMKSIYNQQNRPQIFEHIIWRTSYDYESQTPALVLYRRHSGMFMEDTVLDKEKEDWERELFIPIASGVTYFNVETFVNNEYLSKWDNKELPFNLVLTISFAQPQGLSEGEAYIPEEELISRTVTIDRTRNVRFNIVVNIPEDENDIQEERITEELEEDPNMLDEGGGPVENVPVENPPDSRRE
jgi:type II secretory pathway component PulJ